MSHSTKTTRYSLIHPKPTACSLYLQVVAFGSSFVPTSTPTAPTTSSVFAHSSLANVPVSPSVPTVSLEDAIAAAEDALDGTFNEHPPTLEFLALEDGSLRLTHVMQIQNAETNAWFEAFVDAQTGEVLSVTDFVTKASVRITLFWLIWDSSYRLYSIWFFPSRRRS
jgi:hypothetical protein